MRVAAYYAPAPNDPLWPAACAWLGRDPETAAPVPQPTLPNLPELPELTEAPRLYGFHATLKPPMRLATAYHLLLADAQALAARTAPFTLPALHVADLSGFLALRETEPCPPLHALADDCVATLDPHRAPPTEAELARRRQPGLPPAQDAMLARWGYPHVMQTWFFHMTLTRRLSPNERDRALPAAKAHFTALLAPRRIDTLTLFTQPTPGAPFLLAERLPFGG